MTKIIAVNPEKCLACKSCEIACAVAHSKSKDLLTVVCTEPDVSKRVHVEKSESESSSSVSHLPFTVPLQCRHCEDAPCVKICPTKALDKTEDGPVLITADRCIGCKWCIIVCPFGVINLDKKGKAIIKCDLCVERLRQGDQPACVSSCPTKSLKFVSVEEIAKDKRKQFMVELVDSK